MLSAARPSFPFDAFEFQRDNFVNRQLDTFELAGISFFYVIQFDK